MFSAFKTLTGQTVTVELKNDLAIQGTLKSVDQYVACLTVGSSTSSWTTSRCLTRAATRTWYVLCLTTERCALDVHSWLGCALRSHPGGRCRHAAARGCDPARCVVSLTTEAETQSRR